MFCKTQSMFVEVETLDTIFRKTGLPANSMVFLKKIAL